MAIKPESDHGKACLLASELVEDIRRLSKTFPEEEDMVMVPQIREAVMFFHQSVLFAADADTQPMFDSYAEDAVCKSAALETFVELAYDFGYHTQDSRDAIVQKISEVCALVSTPFVSRKPQLRIVK